MIISKNKPYIIKFAEIIYEEITSIKIKNQNLETENAINKFIDTKTFNELSTGKLHDKWFNQLKINNYIDNETGEKIPIETIRLLEIQRDLMIKQLIKAPKQYEVKSGTIINTSKKTYELLWRMCESYELWCYETKQKKKLSLRIIK